MGKTLVIAEKPSVGRDIARVLGCGKNINGGLEGGQYIVTWGLGHLVTLADPEQYSDEYKEWKMESLPMLPKPMKLEVIKQTSKQFQAVKTQIHRNDVQDVIIATDAGREGELVARWILEKAGNKKPTRRLWISSVTDKAIRQGFANLRPGKEYDNLYRAAVSRAEADWLVGINATRALTCKYNAQLSCGRVQTPTLAMIARKEEEIKNFHPQPYYGLKARVEGISLTWQDAKSGSTRSFDRERIEKLQKELRQQQAVVSEVTKSAKKTMAPQLYDLTELQRDANKKYNYSAKETLNIMQRLYENHKMLTYPRTDSRYLTSDVVETLHERLQACSVGPYRKLAAPLLKKKFQGKQPFVDNSKVSDHHAIIPTEQFVQLEHMTNEERKIYDLVVRRFLAVMYPPFEYEQTTIQMMIGTEKFTAKGKIVKSLGWKEIYENMAEDDEEEDERDVETMSLPDLKKGTVCAVTSISVTEGKTTPPAPFNEATLLSAMENPVKYMESSKKEDIKTLGETGGLGTVATRADIIEKLFHSFLLEKRGKDIYLTSKARQLLKLVPEDLRKPELTAQWERKLARISEGSMRRDTFMEEIVSYTDEIIDEIKTGEGKFQHDNLTNKKCPQCGKLMLMVKGKNSTMLTCQDRECGYRETISRTSNARCPKCHKKMELRGKGEAQMFVCACGHKEKLSSFQERRKKEGAGVTRRDVNRYLNQMKKEEEPLNNAFTVALQKLKQE
ncbi:MAG: DNA topoisomerase III [Lachnospiraceae bacterium]|nr:DNA topoisomerase III [Robinsoniella sp.]MDY3766408.1 DNA topoisomerase III [Lachnospiraceae bacterium]